MPWVETNGIDTFYHDYGTGQPLVVLHGMTADHQVWAEQLQPLTDEFRVLPYDLRGHGKTGESDPDHYTAETYADDLAAFIDALDLDQPVVLGHSWGGMVGYTFAAEYPDQLSALITVGSSTPYAFSKKEWLFKSVIFRVLFPVMTNERLSNIIERVMIKIWGEDATVDLDEWEQLRKAHDCDVQEMQPTERRKVMRAILEYRSTESWELPKTPLLMLYGENEPMIDAHAEYLETELSDCQSVEIPGSGHNAQVDNPSFIRTQIREFLDIKSEPSEDHQVRS